MSGAPLRLTPPPDYSKIALPVSIGLGIAVVVYTLTRSTLPRVGDPSHELPHGGWYKDGTKTVLYNSPSQLTGSHIPFLLALLLPILIYVSSLPCTRSPTRVCNHCGSKHH
nr:MAG: triple gene block protein 2 [Opuntia potexvirus A]